MDQAFEARRFWMERIGALRVVPLPFGPPPAGHNPEPIEIELTGASAERLQYLTKGAPLLRHACVIAAAQVALSLHTGAAEAIVGSPPRLREHEPPPNLLPISQSVEASMTFRSLLTAVRRSLLDAFELQAFPCRQLYEELHPLSLPVKVAVALTDFSGPLDVVPELLIEANVSAEHVRLRLDGHGRIASDALVVFGEHVARALAAGVDDPAVTIGAIEFSTPEERQLILNEWNATDAQLPEGSVIACFEAQAARRPTAIALSGERQWTYGELNARANRLAHRLRAYGVSQEARVGLFLRRPDDLIASQLAVLKAGGVYVPLDPDYPRERIKRVLVEAAPGVVVTEAASAAELPPCETKLLMLDDAEGSSAADPGNTCVPIYPDQLAYTIYTSGSTGEPRGVMVTHGSLANAIDYFANRSGVDERSRVSQICSFSFDASALECYLALTRGATLCIAPRAARASGPALGAFLRDERVTVIGAITPSVLELVDTADAATVRAIHIGAEKCPADLADRWSPGRLLLNCYGPTEATIDCICWPCAGEEGDPPLGRPIANARAYVLDTEMRPVSVGVVGELYVGGISVARGYERRPSRTAAVFVPDPFGDRVGARLYRTGDLARFRPDGRLDFCGRVDRQVKIDGLRIELGEIESLLRMHPGVAQAVVEVKGDRERRLVSYFVAAGASPSARELREHLSALLPSSMLPSAFVELKQFPITSNGKLDRDALPPPSPEHADVEDMFEHPQTMLEQSLAKIYGEVLRVEVVGRDDNFFELGGRSLDVTRVMAKVAKEFSVELPFEVMFNDPTPARLAQAVADALASEQPTSESLPLLPLPARPAVLPLSFSQQRLWFLHTVLPQEATALYNGPIPVRLQGRLDRQALVRSFDEIIRRHEVLRTAFRLVNGEPTQVVLPELRLEIESVDLRGYSRTERFARVDQLAEMDARRPFDLAQPPLLRANLIILDEDDHILLLNIHHIIFDAWSVDVLLNELSQLYTAFLRGESSPLPPLPLQYADFALWQRRWLTGSRLDEQLAYWRTQLANLSELELPTDAERPKLPTYRGEVESFRIAGELTDKLKVLSREHDVTLFMTLFAGFTALLHRYTAQEDIVVSSPVANRRRTELEGLIGFFVNSLVLRTDFSGNPTFRELLGRVRRVTLEAYEHQDVPFERLVEDLRPERVATHNPLFRAAFSLQNTPMRPAAPQGITVTPWETHNRTAKFDLVLAMTDGGETLLADVEYSSEMFERATILNLIRLYSRLLECVAHDPDLMLLEIPLAERKPEPATAAIAGETFKF